MKKMPLWIKIILPLVLAALIALIVVISFVSSKYNQMQIEEIPKDEILVNEEVLDNEKEYNLGKGYTNFVVFGSDSREKNVESNLNTDTIIIVSLNNETKEIKMVSVYRDTLLDVGDGVIAKCNSAYSRGGAKNAINMLNKNLDLNIQYYVTIDFSVVVDVVDMIGGIEVDVSEAEAKAVNDYIVETANVSGKEAVFLENGGVQLLDGVQATTYARIRKGVGDDYARTERQRLIIQKIAEKIMASDISLLNDIIDEVLPRVSTNLSMVNIIKYASCFNQYKIGDTSGFPFEKSSGYIQTKGSCVYALSLSENVKQLHKFLYEIEDYEPSQVVQELEVKIDEIVKQYKIKGTEVDADKVENDTEEDDDVQESADTSIIQKNDAETESAESVTETNISTDQAETSTP